MGKVFYLSFTLSICALACAPAAYCDGILGASSEATWPGYPVLSGPGATILSPGGITVFPSNDNRKKKADDEDKAPPPSHEVVGQVKIYTWGPKPTVSTLGAPVSPDTTPTPAAQVNPDTKPTPSRQVSPDTKPTPSRQVSPNTKPTPSRQSKS